MEWTASHRRVVRQLATTFADTHSLALQQSLYAMGRQALADQPSIAEIRLTLSNQHHVEVDLSAFGRCNSGTVFRVEDQPYGLIEGTVLRDEPEHGLAWW